MAAAEDVTEPMAAWAGRAEGIDTPAVAYAGMAERWDLPDDLMGGTLVMRRRRDKWLPMDEKEQHKVYEARLNRSYLYPGFGNTVTRLSSLPFTKPVTVQGADLLTPQLSLIEADADYAGTSLTQFARALFEDAATHGLTHVLVDYPATDAPATSGVDEIQKRLHPYFAHIAATAVIGWTAEKGPDGRMRLLDVRIKETATVRDGWKERTVDRIRVVTAPMGGTPGVHVVYECVKEGPTAGQWTVVEVRTHTFPGVPLRTIYFRRTGYMTATPPLEDLAWVNLAHYQSASDQRHILHVARVPLLVVAGVQNNESQGPIVVGPNRHISSPDPSFKVEFVEHSGAAIGAGRQDLLDLQAQMELLGLQPMLQRTGDVTATASAIDEARVHADVHAWVRSLEDGLYDAYAFAAQYVGTELPEDFAVEVFSEFGLSLRAAQDVQNLIGLWNARAITAVTLLREVQRRGLLSGDVDVEAEAEGARDEQPPLASFGGDMGDDDSGNEDDDTDDGRPARRAAA